MHDFWRRNCTHVSACMTFGEGVAQARNTCMTFGEAFGNVATFAVRFLFVPTYGQQLCSQKSCNDLKFQLSHQKAKAHQKNMTFGNKVVSSNETDPFLSSQRLSFGEGVAAPKQDPLTPDADAVLIRGYVSATGEGKLHHV